MASKLVQRMLSASGKTAKDARAGSEVGDIFREVGIRETSELTRIAKMPRRNWEDLLANNYGEALSRHLRRPGARCTLLPAQVASLTEYHDYGGFLGALGLGAGKCCAGDTELYDPTFGRRTMREQGFHTLVASDSEGKQQTRLSNVVSSGVKPCVRVSLDDGSSATTSLDHPFFTHRGWVPAAELQPDDMVAVARKYPAPEQPYKIPRDDLILCAYLMSNGGVTTSSAIFCDDNPTLIEECLEISQRVSGVAPVRADDSGKAQQWRLNGLRAFRDKYGMHGLSKEKRVPAEFWRLSDADLRLFVGRFWASDGWVSGQEIGLGLASQGLIDDIRFMLLRLNIRTRKRFKPVKLNGEVFDSWNIVVVRDDNLDFFKQIDLPGMDRQVNECIELVQAVRRNTNVDVVPIARPEITQIALEMGLKKGAQGLNRSQLRNYACAHSRQKLSRVKFADFCEHFDYHGNLSWLAHSDFIWTYVKEITDVGELEVFDASVPDFANFFGNHILLHNTLVTLLAPTLVGAEHPVLLIPGGLRDKTIRDADRYRAEGWLVHPQIRLVSYEEVSRNPTLLLELAPDHLICDEVSALKNLKKAACAKRVAHLMHIRPGTHFMGLSGTVSTRSLHEFWHLLMWSSRANFMPLPRNPNELAEWALAVDEKIPGHARMAPGALITKLGQGIVVPDDVPEHLKELAHARLAVQRRLHETASFLHTSTLSCDASLSMAIVEPPYSALIEDAIIELRESVALEGEDTNGEFLLRPADVWAKARMAAQGFQYDWEPPPPDEWRTRRRHWHRCIRWCLGEYSRLCDSPMQVANHIDKGSITTKIDVSSNPEKPDMRTPQAILAAWREIAPTYKYRLVPRWFDDSRMRWIAKRYLGPKSPACIVWVEHIAVGRKLHELSGRPFHHEGGFDGNGVFIEDARGPIIASVDANCRGKNLQQYFRNFIVSAEPTGETWEQLFGRTHRQGQEEDHVFYEIMQACTEHKEGLVQVLKDARYAFQTLGQPQRLLLADKVNL